MGVAILFHISKVWIWALCSFISVLFCNVTRKLINWQEIATCDVIWGCIYTKKSMLYTAYMTKVMGRSTFYNYPIVCVVSLYFVSLWSRISAEKIDNLRSGSSCLMGKILRYPSFWLVTILGHWIIHMQLFWWNWCSSKIYYSNIVQVEEYVVC